MDLAQAEAVLTFWFSELETKSWFTKDKRVDRTIDDRFRATYDRLAGEVPVSWLDSGRGVLAAVIVLDQFPRNMFRDSPQAFATDAQALALAKDAIARNLQAGMSIDERKFLYMPFQHSEVAEDHLRSLELFAETDAYTLQFAQAHKDIIDRFGRYPHRNAVLGRASTPAELAFLEEPGSSF